MESNSVCNHTSDKKKLDNCRSLICLSLQESKLLIMSMINDRIGQHKALLLINQHYDNLRKRN